MPTSIPLPLRLEKELHDLLDEGSRRTPHKKQELIRLTLRRHLRTVIDEQAAAVHPGRLTNIEPWQKGALAGAYRRIKHEGWETIEEAAIQAQGKPALKD